jgi:hypothetical protein
MLATSVGCERSASTPLAPAVGPEPSATVGEVTASPEGAGVMATSTEDVELTTTESAARIATTTATVEATEPGGSEPTPVWTPDACHRAAFVGDVTVPDGTVLAPGEVFMKVWRLRNAGNCSWRASARIVLEYGDPLGGFEGMTALFYPAGEVPEPRLGAGGWADRLYQVQGDQVVDLPIMLRAPEKRGTYRAFYRLETEAAAILGRFWVEIRVEEEAQAEDLGWGGNWSVQDPSITEPLVAPMGLEQRGAAVHGFLYGFDGRLYLIEGEVVGGGSAVEGRWGEPWHEGNRFRWELRENGGQFQGVYWMGSLAAGEFCGGRESYDPPFEACLPEAP